MLSMIYWGLSVNSDSLRIGIRLLTPCDEVLQELNEKIIGTDADTKSTGKIAEGLQQARFLMVSV